MPKKQYRVVQPDDKSYTDIAERFGLTVSSVLAANGSTDPSAQPPDGTDIWLEVPAEWPESAYQYGTDSSSSPKALTYEQIIANPYGGLWRVHSLEVAGKWPRNATTPMPRDFHALWRLYENRDFREWQLRNGGRAESMKHPGECMRFLRNPPPLFFIPKPKATALVPEGIKAVQPDPSRGANPSTIVLSPETALSWTLSDTTELPAEPRVLTVKELIERRGLARDAIEKATSPAERALHQALRTAYIAILEERVALMDMALEARLPALREELEAELVKRATMSDSAHVEELLIEGLGAQAEDVRVFKARLRMRHTHYSIMPMVTVSTKEVVLGGVYPTGDTETPEQYWSKMGTAESVGLGPIEWLLFAWGIIGALRTLSRLVVRAVAVRLTLTEVGITGAGVLGRARFLPAVQKLARRFKYGSARVTPDASMPAGAGETDKFGNIVYSTRGSMQDQQLVLLHEKVHSWLSPKFLLFRELRADVGMWLYNRSALMKYLEEALAETYAQLQVNGVRSLLTGIRFPIANGYVTLKAVAAEAAVVTITVGGIAYAVTYVAERAIDRAVDPPRAP